MKHKIIQFLYIILLSSCEKEFNNKIVVFWGDSFVYGTGVTSSDSTINKVFTKLTGVNSINMGVPGQTSTQTKDSILRNVSLLSYPVIIWTGRNNSTDTTTIIKDLSIIVKKINHANYLILAVDRASYEPCTNNVGNRISALNIRLKEIYKEHFIDWYTYLQNQNDKSSNDLSDVDNCILPRSLRSDEVHLNNKGYFLVANQLASYKKILISK